MSDSQIRTHSHENDISAALSFLHVLSMTSYRCNRECTMWVWRMHGVQLLFRHCCVRLARALEDSMQCSAEHAISVWFVNIIITVSIRLIVVQVYTRKWDHRPSSWCFRWSFESHTLACFSVDLVASDWSLAGISMEIASHWLIRTDSLASIHLSTCLITMIAWLNQSIQIFPEACHTTVSRSCPRISSSLWRNWHRC